MTLQPYLAVLWVVFLLMKGRSGTGPKLVTLVVVVVMEGVQAAKEVGRLMWTVGAAS